MDSCCTCATILSPTPPSYYDKEAEPQPILPQDRRLECCARIICGKCINNNKRFADYCPYCQISSTPSPLPQRLRDPPAYTSVPSSSSRTAELSDTPPPYTPTSKTIRTKAPVDDEKAALEAQDKSTPAEDILHFIDHSLDTVMSLSLRYGVPAPALRQANNLTSDHLLVARRTVLIPGEYYKGGVSLSPRPVEGEEEELRKGKIRRFMTSCKVSDYDEAVLYLEQSAYDLAAAVEAYMDDERWEAEHPADIRGKAQRTSRAHESRGPFWRGL
ncbi:hypothetical protein B0T10DRAFT_159090 [Thelonectria olida]|uniref:LysM domain-containing protein n=1 Tax=Thelonectria olida TaxID=1576542 RepID=A0A9P8WDE8_9HYPO|nr:hypothetical protein B0T10DRAFT_159090 [Thelonectria olida]